MQIDLTSSLTLHRVPAGQQPLAAHIASNATACAQTVTSRCVSSKVAQLLLPEPVRSKIDSPVSACFTVDTATELPACNGTDAAIKSTEAIVQALQAQMLELNIMFGQTDWRVRTHGYLHDGCWGESVQLRAPSAV